MRPLNLASQPFRGERLPSLLLGLLGLALLGVTIEHALVLRRLLPGRTSALWREVAALEGESRALRAEAASLRVTKPDPAALAHWQTLKELVDRKMFSWTGLFSVLEEALPDSIRLVSIVPNVQKGEVSLDLEAVARSNEDGLDFIRTLEERDEFAEVVPLSRSGEGGTQFRYTMKYLPPPAPSPEASAPPGPPADGVKARGEAEP